MGLISCYSISMKIRSRTVEPPSWIYLIRILKWGALLLVLNLITYAAVVPVLFFQSPFSATDYTDNIRSSLLEEITIEYSGGVLCGWKCGTRSDSILLFFGGDNADTNRWMHNLIASHSGTLEQEATVMTVDYPTFGKSSGTISERAFYETAFLLFDYARERYPDADIIPMGYSIGTAAALRLACDRDCSALILVAPMYDGTSLYLKRDGFMHGLFEPFASVRMQNDEDATRCSVQALVVASKTDRVTKLPDIKALCSLFPKYPDLRIMDECSHSDYWSRDEVYACIASYIRESLSSRRAST